MPYQKGHESYQREEMRAGGRGDGEKGKKIQGTIYSLSDDQPVFFLTSKNE